MLIAGRFELGSVLGRGGMGEVWRARDQRLDRDVAVKLLPLEGRDPEAATRFEVEARTAARLSDPHVVKVYDFGSFGGRLYLVMELIEGMSLAEELALNGPMPVERATGIAAQSAAGLAAAHSASVIHRDVKPSNLLVAVDGCVKIADFGVATFSAGAGTAITTTGEILGTAAYLAPERAAGRVAGPGADVYALGCVLYQMLTGSVPFTGDNVAAVLYQHVHEEPVPASVRRPDVPRELDHFLSRMLAKDPNHRPTSAETSRFFADRMWADDSPVRPHMPVRPAAELAATGTVILGAAHDDGPPRRRSARLGVVVGALLLTGLLVGGALVELPRHTSTPLFPSADAQNGSPTASPSTRSASPTPTVGLRSTPSPEASSVLVEASVKPSRSPSATATSSPAPTAASPSPSPSETTDPGDSGEPTPTPTPTGSPAPSPTGTSEPAPTPTPTPTSSKKPEPSKKPKPSKKPEPTTKPKPSKKPKVVG